MAQRVSRPVAEHLRIWGPLAVVVAVGFVVTYQYVGAPPPRSIRIATGTTDGAYFAFAQRYAQLLAADGIALDVVPTAGSAANLEMLRRGEVTLALVQGGMPKPDDRRTLQALASLFLEPLWVLTAGDRRIQRLSELEGTRLAVGARGSGTHVLATQVLAASGITPSNAMLIYSDPSASATLLSRGDVDAAFLVASPAAPFVRDALQHPTVEVFDFERAPAFSRVFPFLTPAVLGEGVLDLARNIPPRNTTVVAAAAMLAARRDLNPSLIPAVLDAVTRVHRSGGVLEARRQFPSADLIDLPINDDAARYITEGPSFLYRWLPYGTAVRLDRLKLLILPFVALLLPLVRVAPPLYQWQIRRRVYRWYAEVRELDARTQDGDAPAVLLARLSALEREVSSVSVPLAYTGELYHLRLHIRLLRQQLAERTSRDGQHRGTQVSARMRGSAR